MEEMVMTLGRGRAACCASAASQICHRLRQKKGAPKVNADQAVKTLLRGFQQVFALGWRDARIVHQKVNPTEAVFDRIQQLLAAGRGGNIPGKRFERGPRGRRSCRLAPLSAFRRRAAV
jgi:hypothetical protein